MSVFKERRKNNHTFLIGVPICKNGVKKVTMNITQITKLNTHIIGLLVLMIAQASHAMVFDNRYIPLLQKPYISIDGRPSHLNANFFATTGSKAIDNKEKVIGIPELNGELDIGKMALALQAVGLPVVLRSDLIGGQPIPVQVDGTIQTQGLEFSYYQSIRDIIGFGFDWLVMRSNSSQQFRPAKGQTNYVPGIDNSYFDGVRREMFEELGLNEAHAVQAGMGDLDLYVKLWHYWEYILKMKRIDADARFGVLVPAGVTTQVNSPASIPFGGNGHWGVYAELDAEFELKEDIKAGIFFRFSKRFKKTQFNRLPVASDPLAKPPVAGQPQIYAVAVGDVTINPGFNFVFSPYVTLENLRAGLGVRVLYTYTKHLRDNWCNAAPCSTKNDMVPTIDLSLVNEFSEWKTDYVSLSVFYDFGKTKVQQSLDPILIFNWDIPSLLFGSERAVNSHKVSLGLEVNF